MKDSQSPPRMPSNGQPEAEPSAAALTVETAAIRIGEAVFTLPRPNRHHNVIWWLHVLGITSGQMHDQGFVLSNGQYATRTLAAKLALSNGQVTALHAPPNLYSEDLWDGGRDLPSMEAIKALSRAEPGWRPISSAPRDGTEAEPSAAWRARPGKRQGDPAGFVRLVQENPGFWLRDFALKYLTLTIDTREPAAFWLADRDGKPIDPQRVLDAIAPTPAHAELSPGNSSDLRGEEG